MGSYFTRTGFLGKRVAVLFSGWWWWWRYDGLALAIFFFSSRGEVGQGFKSLGKILAEQGSLGVVLRFVGSTLWIAYG
jgi:hypothetical protein